MPLRPPLGVHGRATRAWAAGFLALPAMQVLVMHDFKDMSGLAGHEQALMTIISTLLSMLVSFYFADWGRDNAVAQPPPRAAVAVCARRGAFRLRGLVLDRVHPLAEANQEDRW